MLDSYCDDGYCLLLNHVCFIYHHYKNISKEQLLIIFEYIFILVYNIVYNLIATTN